MFTKDPSLLERGDNYKNARCCDIKWDVPEEFAICGKSLMFNTSQPIFVHDCVEEASYWNYDYQDGINIDVIILFLNIFISWVILIFIETNLIRKGYIKLLEVFYGSRVSAPAVVDEDVQREKDSIYMNNNMMKVINLTKKFGRFDAVRGLTFGVREKECFGLLGVNGAGKTTTFRFVQICLKIMHTFFLCRMITGDEVMTTGESFIGNVSLRSEKSTYLQSIGYCPQFDSIIEVSKSLVLIK